MAELSGLFGEIERLKHHQPISYLQALLAARNDDGPNDGRGYWPETRRILDEAGITEDGVMTQESKDILTGATTRQLAAMPPKQRLREMLLQNRAAIMAAMPKHMNSDRLLRVAQTACTSTPQLLECYVPSLLGGIMQAAQFGLEPNTPMGHCYLVPYRRNLAKRGQPPRHRQDCQLIVGYRGMIDLARRSGQIVSIAAHDVREGDFFEYEYGLEEKLRHRPAATLRGEITHFYAVAKLVGGGHAMDVMSVDDVRAVMLGTKSGGRWGPWKDHFQEMGRKTAIRRLAKYLPMSVELSQAASGDSSTAELGPDGAIDSVVMDEFIDTTPGEQEAATEPTQEEPEPIAAAQDSWPVSVDVETGGSEWVDSTGERFDPERHATAKSGRPAVTRDGSFRARRGAAAEKPKLLPARHEVVAAFRARRGAAAEKPDDQQHPPQAQENGGGTKPYNLTAEDVEGILLPQANGGGTKPYNGPSVTQVMRMIEENVSDFDGVADVRAILSEMPADLQGKEQCEAALETVSDKFRPF